MGFFFNFVDFSQYIIFLEKECRKFNWQLIRLACKEAHVRMDCSRKFASVIHRKAAPISGDYAVGDLICFKREKDAKTPEEQWSSVTRIVGFDGPKVVGYQ